MNKKNDTSKKIAVIGAGVSGLTAAYTLQKLGYNNVKVFESENRPGGKVHSYEHEGRFHELGAVWFGSRMNMKIGNLNETVTHLERQVSEGRASMQTALQEIGVIVRLHKENRQTIQKIERGVAGLKLSTKADFETLREQVGDLREASTASDVQGRSVPTLEPTGDWGVNLASFTNRDAATREMEKIRGTGIELVTREAMIADKRWYRLRVEGFPDLEAARIFIQEHRGWPEFSGAWISRER